jgi:hypothetical protein
LSSFFFADAEAEAFADADGIAEGNPDAEPEADIEGIADALIDGIALGRTAALCVADAVMLAETDGLVADAELEDDVLLPPPPPSSHATTDSDSTPRTTRMEEPRMDVFLLMDGKRDSVASFGPRAPLLGAREAQGESGEAALPTGTARTTCRSARA